MSPTNNSITPLPTGTTASNGNTNSSSGANGSSPLASETTFLKLLVSQLQNQDPLNPMDSTQFVSQLTSYSQLEQLINIDKNTTPAAASAASSSNGTTSNGTTPASSGTTPPASQTTTPTTGN
jgi:flagellar basal-body rod modification protein FlgD